MGVNLFTDVYEVRQMCFGEQMKSEAEMDRCRKEVFDSIKNKTIAPLRFLMFKMTNYCNSDCAYCSHAVSAAGKEVKSELPFEVIKNTILQAKEMGVTAVSVNGGEPLMHRDILRIVSVCRENHITPVLMTNGLLLPDCWEKLGEAGVRYVIISVDSFDKKNYEMQRGASFEKAMEGIAAAVKMKEKYGTSIHVTSVLTSENSALLPDMIRKLSDMGIWLQISPYHHFNPHQKDELSITSEEEINNLTECLLEMKEQGYLIANSRGFIQHFPGFFLEKKRIPDEYECLIGYTNLFIDAYGNVKPCWASCFDSLGNIREKTLKEMWESEQMARYREDMLSGRCEGCWYLCTGEVTMFLKNNL